MASMAPPEQGKGGGKAVTQSINLFRPPLWMKQRHAVREILSSALFFMLLAAIVGYVTSASLAPLDTIIVPPSPGKIRELASQGFYPQCTCARSVRVGDLGSLVSGGGARAVVGSSHRPRRR